MSTPEVWWSRTAGLLREVGHELSGPDGVLSMLPADAVRLVPEGELERLRTIERAARVHLRQQATTRGSYPSTTLRALHMAVHGVVPPGPTPPPLILLEDVFPPPADGEDDVEVWIPPAGDCLEQRHDKPCPHCGDTGYHHRTRRCAGCGRRPTPPDGRAMPADHDQETRR